MAGAVSDDKPDQAVMSSRDLWRIAIALILEGKQPLNHEDCERALRSENYQPE